MFLDSIFIWISMPYDAAFGNAGEVIKQNSLEGRYLITFNYFKEKCKIRSQNYR